MGRHPPQLVNDEIEKHINTDDEVETEKPVEAPGGSRVSHAAAADAADAESSGIPPQSRLRNPTISL